ncbi:MAG: hypothetical protein KBT04_03075, partial [Bacteroidales bacterium]|nr:hypothetical protein [Candidatus Colimorpha onthohippi]
TITLRRMAQGFGIEKLVLRQEMMSCHFVASQDNPFYQSENFGKLIRYAQNHPTEVRLKESGGRLSLICREVENISQAIEKLTALISGK